MRQLIFALAFAATACATPHANADTMQVDPQILRTCVAQAGQDRAALSQCVGLVTRACVEAEGGSNSMTDVLCRSGEADVWTTIIEERTASITTADPVDGNLLATSSQAWETWRDVECEYRAYEYGGGAGEQYDRIVCYLDLTSERAISLITAR